MSFKARQDRRQCQLSLLSFAATMVAGVYLSLHAAVVALAFKLSGAGAALVTLPLLGFADLYWAITWFREQGQGAISAVAAIAGLLCFASWLGRPVFNCWADAFTAEMLRDGANTIETITRARDTSQSEPAAEAGDDQTAERDR